MMADDRSRAMADRLARSVAEAGLGADAAHAVLEALAAAFAVRQDIPPNDPAALHPARNALILLEDIGVRDAVELCAAIHYDGAGTPAGEPEDARVRTLLDAVPVGRHPDRLLEDLVTAPDAARRIALADRLDHARHLHLRSPDGWAAFHAQTRDVWLPAAERTHDVFARRFRWWTDMFQRRWLDRARS